MKKIFRSLFFLTLVVLFLSCVQSVRAAFLSLNKISGTSVVGLDYSLVSYTGPMPILEGMATPGAVVSITINSVSTSSATATASGGWIFVPTSLKTGANTILLTSGSEKISFVVQYTPISATVTAAPTVTSAASSTSTSTSATLPSTGMFENTIMIIGGGLILFVLGWATRKYFHYWEKH